MDPNAERLLRRVLEEIVGVGELDSKNGLWAEMSLLPAILNKTGCIATPLSVSSAIASLENFLPGLSSGSFCFEEILAIQDAHGYNALGDVEEMRSTLTPIQEKTSSWRFQGDGKRLGREKQDLPVDDGKISPGLALPTRESVASAEPMSEREIWRLFEKFDVTGDHKLTFMSIKSALELYNGDSWNNSRCTNDSQIRDWIREHDADSKGYVDFDNFKRIFGGAASREQIAARSTEATKREELLKKYVLLRIMSANALIQKNKPIF